MTSGHIPVSALAKQAGTYQARVLAAAAALQVPVVEISSDGLKQGVRVYVRRLIDQAHAQRILDFLRAEQRAKAARKLDAAVAEARQAGRREAMAAAGLIPTSHAAQQCGIGSPLFLKIAARLGVKPALVTEDTGWLGWDASAVERVRPVAMRECRQRGQGVRRKAIQRAGRELDRAAKVAAALEDDPRDVWLAKSLAAPERDLVKHPGHCRSRCEYIVSKMQKAPREARYRRAIYRRKSREFQEIRRALGLNRQKKTRTLWTKEAKIKDNQRGQRRRRNMRGSRTIEQLREQYAAQHGACFYCGTGLSEEPYSWPDCPDGWTRDHVRPISRGGRDEIENIVLACHACNSQLGDTFDDLGG